MRTNFLSTNFPSTALQPLAEADLESSMANAARAARRALHVSLGFSADAVAQAAIDKLELEIASGMRAARKHNDAKGQQLVARLYAE